MVATKMEALLAHRGALVHVDHSHRLERRCSRAGASPSAPRGHQEVPTATPGVIPVHITDLHIEVWENMLEVVAVQDCKNVEELCKKLKILCKGLNVDSPCSKQDFWKGKCTSKGWLFKDPNYVPYDLDDPEDLIRWRKQYWLFCLVSKECPDLVEPLQNLGDGGVVGSNAFGSCRALDMESLPEGITHIEEDAFFQCTNLALTSLPNGITEIKEGAFHGCSALALTSLPENLTTIKSRTFEGCSALALTSLPENLTRIGPSAFQDCRSLALTSLPEKLAWISYEAFMNCSAIQITIPPFPRFLIISLNAFKGCPLVSFE